MRHIGAARGGRTRLFLQRRGLPADPLSQPFPVSPGPLAPFRSASPLNSSRTRLPNPRLAFPRRPLPPANDGGVLPPPDPPPPPPPAAAPLGKRIPAASKASSRPTPGLAAASALSSRSMARVTSRTSASSTSAA